MGVCPAAVTLDDIGVYLTKHGYGGAPLVHPGNFYYLPFQSNGKGGNLIIDTGSPTSVIFRWSLKELNLVESKTKLPAGGAFGTSGELLGLTTIKTLSIGNCTLSNVPVAVDPGNMRTVFSPTNSNGLLGLRELVKFGAVLDLPHRLIYLRPSRPGKEVGDGIRSILSQQGYTPVPLSVNDFHLRIPGAVNAAPCSFVVDTGAYVTTLDTNFVSRAKVQVQPTRLKAMSLSTSTIIGMGIIGSLRLGSYELRRASVSIAPLNPRMLRRGTSSEAAGLIGVEYLGMNSAIFDFINGTMYLRPQAH